MDQPLRPLIWVGRSKDDFSRFPRAVQANMGFVLYRAQEGGKHVSAKPLAGFAGAGVLEAIEQHDGNTFRAVYTVRIAESVHVLHAFQKKSKSGVRTPQSDVALIERRLKAVLKRDQDDNGK